MAQTSLDGEHGVLVVGFGRLLGVGEGVVVHWFSVP